MSHKVADQYSTAKNPANAGGSVSSKLYKASTTSKLDKRSMLNKAAKNKGDKF